MSLLFVMVMIVLAVASGLLLGAAIKGAKYILENSEPNQSSEAPQPRESGPMSVPFESDFDKHLKGMRDR